MHFVAIYAYAGEAFLRSIPWTMWMASSDTYSSGGPGHPPKSRRAGHRRSRYAFWHSGTGGSNVQREGTRAGHPPTGGSSGLRPGHAEVDHPTQHTNLYKRHRRASAGHTVGPSPMQEVQKHEEGHPPIWASFRLRSAGHAVGPSS